MSVHTKVLANVQTFAIGTYAILIDHYLQKEPTNSRKLALFEYTTTNQKLLTDRQDSDITI